MLAGADPPAAASAEVPPSLGASSCGRGGLLGRTFWAALRCPFLIEQISEPGLLAAHTALLQQTTAPSSDSARARNHSIAIAHQQAQHRHQGWLAA